jgi:isopentenyl diphosphate isomerase/L-lactate dehydrogenase-like FMN-dependent dehydrogenase
VVWQVDDKPHDAPNSQEFSYYDASLNWSDVDWIKRHAGDLPVYIKGIATVEVSGVIVSKLGVSRIR